MISLPFKQSGIIRAGFDYQDLMGIEILIKFFRDPHLFKWVSLEADDKAAGYLDDIVAERADGGIELIQVKFTVDPERYALDWDWLLERTPRGLSLLQKWSTSLVKAGEAGPIHSARLRTNRRPDGAVAAALVGTRLDIALLPADRRGQILADLGGDESANKFFAIFEICHTERMIDDFEWRLKSEIVPTDTDISGWLLLREQARLWATRRGQPEPDGKIRHEHLVQIITKKRPKPMPQDFQIPDSYHVPSSAFHHDFLQRVETGERAITALWGSPGRGKSTYLSVAVDELRKRSVPVVRHHYFLSLSDATADRISYPDIAASLMDQMTYRYPDAVRGLQNDAMYLRRWVEACGAHYKSMSKPFVLVIDGLDHVWRESGSIQQMEHLFNQLLPCPENVVVIVGTQRVAESQLPHRLLRRASTDDWVEIPEMDETAVHHWLSKQVIAGRMRLPDMAKVQQREHVNECVREFHQLSGGHPLHLIYSFEALVRRGGVATPDEIKKLPACPDGDIRKYYESLWRTLPDDGRRALHLIAGAEFQWPPDGLRICAGGATQVDHLLDHRRAGLMPFHGSILAYARERPDHDATFRSMLPEIVRWLENEAEEYLQWGWLWLMKAKAGDTAALLAGVNRNWVTRSLARGSSDRQIVAILRAAERIVFDKCDYAKTAELRSLKIRVLNGPEYQTNEWERFREVALLLGRNESEIARMADALPTLPDKAVATLARACSPRLSEIRDECALELRTRVNQWIALRHRRGDEVLSLMKHLFETLALASEFDVVRTLQFIAGFNKSEEVLCWLVDSLVRHRRLDALLEALQTLSGKQKATLRHRVEDALVQVCASEGVDLQARYRRGRAKVSPVLAVWQHVHKVKAKSRARLLKAPDDLVCERYDPGPHAGLEDFFFNTFFNVLASSWASSSKRAVDEAEIAAAGDGWMESAVACLVNGAKDVGSGKAQLAFATPYFYSRNVTAVLFNGRSSDGPYVRWLAFRRALLRIAVTLHHLKCPIGRQSELRLDEVIVARMSPHWLEDGWIEFVLNQRWPFVSAELAANVVNAGVVRLDSSITEFNERADTWCKLAQFAQLTRNARADELLLRSASCLVGYGWRKDFFLADVLDCVASVHDAGHGDARGWLRTLVPIVDNVTKFTDGDETDHIRSDLIEVVSRVEPEKLPDFYARHLARGEYRYAQDALEAHSKRTDYATPIGAALARTYVDGREVNLLSRESFGDAKATLALTADRVRFLGGVPPVRDPYGKQTEEKDVPVPDLSQIAATDFRQALDAATRDPAGYKVRDDALGRWLSHWVNKGKGAQALGSLREYFDTEDNPSSAEGMLDAAFEASLLVEGRDQAYAWLVRAHAHRNGWQSNWSSEREIMRRLRRTVELYPDRWQTFIRDTSKPIRYWQVRGEGFSIGFKYLVRFLVMSGQVEQACRFTESCIDVVVAEVSDQPLPKQSWLQ